MRDFYVIAGKVLRDEEHGVFVTKDGVWISSKRLQRSYDIAFPFKFTGMPHNYRRNGTTVKGYDDGERIIKFISGQSIGNHMKELKEKYPNAYKIWSKEDDAELLRLHKEGVELKVLSETFQRNIGAIRSRLEKLTETKTTNDMEVEKLEIEIPAGKEVDWQASASAKKIVLMDKRTEYSDVLKALNENNSQFTLWNQGDDNWMTGFPMAYNINAKVKLANVAKYLNKGWAPKADDTCYRFVAHPGGFGIRRARYMTDFEVLNGSILFRSGEAIDEAMKILSPDEIRLALKPLY